MKPQLTLLAFFLLLGSLTAQVKFKVKLLPDNQTYQVLFRPDINWSNPASTTLASAQVSIRVPVGGFSVGTITNHKGVWKKQSEAVAPAENPGYHYINFAPDAIIPGSQITYTEGVEIPMFSFINTGACTGPVEIVENSDPFFPPNALSFNVGNFLSTIGAGNGVQAYTGSYITFDPDCRPLANSCGVEVFDVALVSPSACGIADGSITISAAHSGGFPLQYTINYGTAQTVWQSSPTFTNLASGDTYYVAVRDLFGTCEVGPDDIGEFYLQGPLAAIIQSVDINQPSCGGTDGSITLNVTSANGGDLVFATSASGPWQPSSTFANLAEGVYTFWVWDTDNNCENIIGTYELSGCVEPSCILTYDLAYLGSGRYEVRMITDTTWTGLDGFTGSMQVTIKVPTGGFEVGNLTSQVQGVQFNLSPSVDAPAEDPNSEYFSFSLASATDSIPYIDGNTVSLFTFENTGTCVGDSIRLMANDDPITTNPGYGLTQQIFVAGYGGDVPICLGNSAAICEAVPPAEPACILTYNLNYLGNGRYGVEMVTDTTWTGLDGFTGSMQVTIKTPTGGFEVANLASQIPGVQFNLSPSVDAPAEDPNSEYFSFSLASATDSIPYIDGNTVSLFTFENAGTCVGDSIRLMRDDDPITTNPGYGLTQQIFVAGYGGDVPICLGNSAVICETVSTPCASLVASFTAPDGCEGTSIQFTNTSTTTEPITSWSWNFGDGSATASGQNPSHVYSSSGNFEVSLTVTTQSGCTATFMDFVTVFPSPGDAPVSSYTICDGLGVTLETPDNITSAVWSPTTGLDLTDPFAPIANPAATTTYSLTATNVHGCVNTSQVQVIVINKPVLANVVWTDITDCNKSDATITITATATGAIQYGLDSGSGITWQAGNAFTNLAAGSYNVYVRNGDGSCPVAFNNNPIVFTAPAQASITSVSQVAPTGCSNNGSITINATGGEGPLQYSITGNPPFQASNVFNNLGAGTYNIVVRNNDGTCATFAGPIVFTAPNPPTITTPVADRNLCVGASANISVTLSAAIASYTVNGNSNYPGAAINGNTLTFPAAATVLGANNYTVVLSEANGCSATDAFTLTGVVAPTASFSVSPTICTNGNVVLNFTGTSNPSATISWALAGAQVMDASLQNGNTPANATMVVRWNTPGTKTVTLTVDNGGCTATSMQTINVADFNPNATFVGTNASCGQPNGAINLSVTGTGYNYLWSTGATTQDINNLVGGQYLVTITDVASGCQTSVPTSIGTSASLSIANISAQPATVCTGASGDGSITVQISGGTPGLYTYAISGQLPVGSTATSVTLENLVSGAYTVTVTDAAGCTDAETVTVGSQSSNVTATVTTVDADCTQNNGSLTATANGGTMPYTYSLIKNNGTVSSNQPVTGNSVTLNSLEPANYTVIFLDANGCIAAGSGVVARQQGVFSATATVTPASCGANNGAIALSGIPAGATIAWSVGGSANPNNNLAAGVYTVTISETNGCTSSSSIAVTTTGGQDVNVVPGTTATCGLANGSITFMVTGGNSFSYNVLGTSLNGFGTAGNPTLVSGIAAGTYVLEVTDNLQPTCKVYEPFTVSGSASLQTSTTVQFATGCGNTDGEIALTVSGGTTPYTVVSSQGNVQAGSAANQFIVTGLSEGIVEIDITDNAQCATTFTQDMGDFAEPVITAGSVTITPATCPGGTGSIVSTSTTQYQILSTSNVPVAGTPWTTAPMGDYKLVYAVGNCSDTLVVTVGGPAAWAVVSTIEADSCVSPGSIALAIAGGTAPYAVNWSNTATGTIISNLQAGTYTATITDANGCSTTSVNVVEDHCSQIACDEDAIFYLDTFIVQLNAALTEVCLPTTLTNLADYDLQLNDEPYERSIGDCGATTHFYNGLDMLPAGGPYVLDTWSYDGPGSPLTNFQFDDVNDLLSKMKELDNLANWVYSAGNISGGRPGAVYSDMTIKHLSSGIINEFPVGKQIVPHPTVLVDNSHELQYLVAIDPITACADTLYLNILPPAQPGSSTMQVDVAEGESVEVCIPVDELFGNIEFLENECISFTNNAQLVMSGDTCITVMGLEEGPDEACIVVCDDLGICDTTFLQINVLDASTDIEVLTGFSPNDDGVNEVFKIKNIHLYPDNELLIINRWGKPVYDVKGYNNSWNGEYRSKKLPDGSYFYILRVNVSGKEKEYKGFVELRR